MRWLAAAVVMSLLVVTGCTGDETSEEPPVVATTADEPTSVTTQVEEDGFRVDLGQVVVQAPAGVANPGTDVTVRLVDSDSPDPEAQVVAAVDIVIGSGEQPEQPVTVSYPLDEEPSDTVDYVVMRTTTGEDDYLTVAHEVVDGRAVVTTDHLSTFHLVRFDPMKWLRELTLQIELALGLQYPKPDCADQDFGHAPDLGDYYFTREGSGLGTIYLCAGRSPEQDLSMQFYSNGPVAWEITADQELPSTMPIVQLRIGDLLATAGYRLAHNYPEDRVILTPGAQIALRAKEADVPVHYSGRVDPLWGAVALGVEAALGVASMGKGDAFKLLSQAADIQDAVTCLTGAVSAGSEPELGPMVSTGTTCAQRMLVELVDKPEALLLFRLGIVSRLVLIAPQGILAALIAEHNNEFSVDLLSIRPRAEEGYAVPEYCDQPERRAPIGESEVDGKYTWLEGPFAWEAVGAEVVAMVCTAGGVTWPGVLLVYDDQGDRVGEFRLAEREPTAYRGSFQIDGTWAEGNRLTVPYAFELSGAGPSTEGTMELTWDAAAGRPVLSGGTASAVQVEAPAGGRGLTVEGETAPEGEAEAWLVERLGAPDNVIERTNCLDEGIAARQLSWGGLDVTILTEPIPQDVYMYGFAYPAGSISGWGYDVTRERQTGNRLSVDVEGVTLPTDLETLRAAFAEGWNFADVVEADSGERFFQAFVGDVTGITFTLEEDDTVVRSGAGISCEG